MRAPAARIAHRQAATRRNRSIWSPTFSLSRSRVTRWTVETQSDQIGTSASRRGAKGLDRNLPTGEAPPGRCAHHPVSVAAEGDDRRSVGEEVEPGEVRDDPTGAHIDVDLD